MMETDTPLSKQQRMSKLLQCITILLLLNPVAASTEPKKIFCFFHAGAFFRRPPAKFDVKYLETSMCTHIIYRDFEMRRGSVVARYTFDKEMLKKIREIIDKVNPKPVLLLSIAATADEYQRYTKSLMWTTYAAYGFCKLPKQYGVDGLSFEWQFLGKKGGPSISTWNFGTLIRKIHDHCGKGPNKYIINLVVSPFKDEIYRGYNIPRLNGAFDFMTILAYDFYGQWKNITSHHAPLFKRFTDVKISNAAELNVDWTVQHFLELGVPAKNLVLAVSGHGSTYTLKDAMKPWVGAPATGPGIQFPYSAKSGEVLYNEVCHPFWRQDADIKYSRAEHMSYIKSGYTWISIDDPQSVRDKVCYARQNNLGGVGFRNIGDDDFSGELCGGWPYPLLTHMYRAGIFDPCRELHPETDYVKDGSPPCQIHEGTTVIILLYMVMWAVI